jgi:RHS repeat-associated protein
VTSTEGLRYTFKDRLGSTTTISNAQGTALLYRNFDAFGKPRKNDGRLISIYSSGSKLTEYNDNTTRRGFTDHEHLDEVELIHMNGRVYDYNVGRFMSVDPFTHGGSQGINPYSYIMNNPMFGTDPTGYEPEEEIIRIVIRCGAGQKCDDPDVGKTDGDHSSRNRDGNGESLKLAHRKELTSILHRQVVQFIVAWEHWLILAAGVLHLSQVINRPVH